MIVGPLPARVSADGALRQLNMFHLGIALRQPVNVIITPAQPAINNCRFNSVRFCILAALLSGVLVSACRHSFIDNRFSLSQSTP